MEIPDEVAALFVEEFDQPLLSHHIARNLTCMEAEAIMSMLCALGAHDASQRWLADHEAGDTDEDDMHYRGERSEPQKAEVSA